MFLLEWPGGSWEATLRMSLLVLGLYLAAIWIACIFWTYRDIRQRTRDPILHIVALAVVVVLFLPGLWIYLILRPRYTLVELYERSLEEEALLQELEDQSSCPTCRRRVHESYLICPTCRTQLKEPCANCGKPLNYAWLSCPFCATDKPSSGPQPQRPRRQRPGNAPAGEAAPAPQATGSRTATQNRPSSVVRPGGPATNEKPASRKGSFLRNAKRGKEPIVDATGSHE